MESLLNSGNNVAADIHAMKKEMNIVFSKLKKEKKKRSCLMCGKLFNSNGPHNRRCQSCDHQATQHEYFQPQFYRTYSKGTSTLVD